MGALSNRRQKPCACRSQFFPESLQCSLSLCGIIAKYVHFHHQFDMRGVVSREVDAFRSAELCSWIEVKRPSRPFVYILVCRRCVARVVRLPMLFPIKYEETTVSNVCVA